MRANSRAGSCSAGQIRKMLVSPIALFAALGLMLVDDGTPRGYFGQWQPVLSNQQIMQHFDLKNGPYKAGHRGIDLRASPGNHVLAPVAAEVVFAGSVVDREVLTLKQADGKLISFEPVSAAVGVGQLVAPGQLIGHVSGLTHCGGGCLHVGLRIGDEYRNPLLYLVGGRARLLPLTD